MARARVRIDPEKLPPVILPAVQGRAELIASQIRVITPVRTGRLLRSVRTRYDRLQAYVIIGGGIVYYWRYLPGYIERCFAIALGVARGSRIAARGRTIRRRIRRR